MIFFDKVGKVALGSRMRMLTEMITEDAARIYKLYDIQMQPKWFPVFYVLSDGSEKTITDIAREIGHSHPSVSKIIAEMIKNDLILENKDKADRRRNMVSLSKKGGLVTAKIQDQYVDVSNAIDELSAQATHDLWKAIQEWEFLLEQKTLLQRVQSQRKEREGKKVRIVDYKPIYAEAFKDLNVQWISTWFKMEDSDYKALDNPEENILNDGGCIVVALYDEKPVGVCGLVKMDDPEYDYELVKMAVSPEAQGRNIGWLLGNAIIVRAKQIGANKIYLESNTILKPAINLYQKLGFQKVAGHPSPYERCNIQMELVINL